MSYTVAGLPPYPQLDEAAPGTGGLCGGAFVNLAFESWLTRKFSNAPRFTKEMKDDVMEKFEENLKKGFDGTDSRPHTIMIRDLRRDDTLQSFGIRRGQLTISTLELTNVFRQVTGEIVKLVRAQISATPREVTTILLAGGFGQSKFLRGELEGAFPDVKVNHVANA
jgi:hypothetical protein